MSKLNDSIAIQRNMNNDGNIFVMNRKANQAYEKVVQLNKRVRLALGMH